MRIILCVQSRNDRNNKSCILHISLISERGNKHNSCTLMNCQIQPDIHASSISSKGIDANAIIIISVTQSRGRGDSFPVLEWFLKYDRIQRRIQLNIFRITFPRLLRSGLGDVNEGKIFPHSCFSIQSTSFIHRLVEYFQRVTIFCH